jgi:hypothetical protein
MSLSSRMRQTVLLPALARRGEACSTRVLLIFISVFVLCRKSNSTTTCGRRTDQCFQVEQFLLDHLMQGTNHIRPRRIGKSGVDPFAIVSGRCLVRVFAGSLMVRRLLRSMPCDLRMCVKWRRIARRTAGGSKPERPASLRYPVTSGYRGRLSAIPLSKQPISQGTARVQRTTRRFPPA